MTYDLSIIGTVGLPARYGGFETLAEALTARFAQRYRLQVFCSSRGRTELSPDYLGARLHYVALHANGWQSIVYDFISLWRAAPCSKAILVLGVSGCLMLPLVRLRSPHVRIVTNVDGLEWKRRKWGFLARNVLRLSEQFAVWFSHVVIADNKGIRDHLRQTYRADSVLIAYGGDTAHARIDLNEATGTRFDHRSYFLAVCRIEPENNVEEVLQAFELGSTANVVVVGNWNVSSYARDLRAQYGDRLNIELLDPIYERAQLDRLRGGALAYVHGHSAGGTNPSLVEAMAAGMAVLAFDVNYNRYTTNDMAHYWTSATDLARLLDTLGDQQLSDNARRMLNQAQEHYTWQRVTSDYERVLFSGWETGITKTRHPSHHFEGKPHE